MNKRFWLGLLLIAVTLLALPPTAMAQRISGTIYPPLKQSHHDLPGGPDLDNPQEMMAQRLRELHELHQLQDQVQSLLKDPDFIKNIQQQMSESQLRQLRDKLLRGEGLGKDQSLNEFLKQAASRQKLDQRQIDILRRWAERNEPKQPTPSEPNLLDGRVPNTPTPPSSVTPSSPLPALSGNGAEVPEPSLLERMQQETTKWMMNHLDDVGGDVLEALTEVGASEEGAPLAELLRSMQQPDLSGMNVSEKAMGLSNYFPNVSEFLHEQRGTWDEVRSIFRAAPVPSLPSFDTPTVSVPVAGPGDGDSWMPALLSLLMLGLIVLLICRMAARSPTPAGSGSAESWRLGAWPVAPGAVATRQDVIRAFEYLALLRLGLSAAACHHRELAERLAEQDSGNPARRQTAEMLACFYEQARYAPAGDALSQEELSDARHALCYLAGATAV